MSKGRRNRAKRRSGGEVKVNTMSLLNLLEKRVVQECKSELYAGDPFDLYVGQDYVLEDCIERTKHPVTGDVMWRFRKFGPIAVRLVGDFVWENSHLAWDLSIFDTMSDEVVAEITDLPVGYVTWAVSYVYHVEHAEPIAWIGCNSLSESYVVGLSCTRGRFRGVYRFDGSSLVKC